ncbi:hypothetical protein GGR52DRAFT_528568 [Hypoxylon sp. FL1284]|nr:hypothetical protein GGR52DRAFT_528568 [Hypoxylon sp. FL1284]
MGAGKSQAEWYASINPNGRMPALVHVKDDETTVTVFESAPTCSTSLASLTRAIRSRIPLVRLNTGRSCPG